MGQKKKTVERQDYMKDWGKTTEVPKESLDFCDLILHSYRNCVTEKLENITLEFGVKMTKVFFKYCDRLNSSLCIDYYSRPFMNFFPFSWGKRVVVG